MYNRPRRRLPFQEDITITHNEGLSWYIVYGQHIRVSPVIIGPLHHTCTKESMRVASYNRKAPMEVLLAAPLLLCRLSERCLYLSTFVRYGYLLPYLQGWKVVLDEFDCCKLGVEKGIVKLVIVPLSKM